MIYYFAISLIFQNGFLIERIYELFVDYYFSSVVDVSDCIKNCC